MRAFARLRELLGDAFDMRLDERAGMSELARMLRERLAGDGALLDVTTFARNGRVARADSTLADGDEVALLPPVGGG